MTLLWQSCQTCLLFVYCSLVSSHRVITSATSNSIKPTLPSPKCSSLPLLLQVLLVGILCKVQPSRAEQGCQVGKSKSTAWLMGFHSVFGDTLAQCLSHAGVPSLGCGWWHVSVRKAALPFGHPWKALLLFWMLYLVELGHKHFTSNILPGTICWTALN